VTDVAIALTVLRVAGSGKLVFQRRDDKAPSYPGKLTFFGGGIEDGEQPREAALRELLEETSLRPGDITDLRDVGTYTVPLTDGRSVDVHLFETSTAVLRFQVYEGRGAESYTRDEALQRADLAEVARRLLMHVGG
jgi:8-oxo-dGTP pyrophosphatase MutT (NUDIX family)